MEPKFPETVFVSIGGSSDDEFLSASKTEEAAIKATENEKVAEVAEYRLVTVRNRAIVTSVADADAGTTAE